MGDYSGTTPEMSFCYFLLKECWGDQVVEVARLVNADPSDDTEHFRQTGLLNIRFNLRSQIYHRGFGTLPGHLP